MKEGWKYCRLGDICFKITDGSHNPPSGIDYSEYPMLSSKNIDFDHYDFNLPRYLTKEQFEIENKRTDITEGDILLTIVGTVGKVCCVKKLSQKFTLQRSVAVLKPNRELLNSKYLMYCLFSLNDFFEKEANGVAQKGIYLKKLSSITIPVPPLEQQHQIVSELDLLSGIIEKQKRQLKELDTLAQSIFYDMFGDPVENEKGWKIISIGECFPYIKNGANIKQDKNAKGYPITRIETLSSGKFNRDRLGYANIYDIRKYTEYVLLSHDLLVSHINSKAYIGRTVEYISQNDEVIIHGMNLLRLKENLTVINSTYFAFYSNTDKFKYDVARIRKDAVNQSSFTITDFKRIQIPLPPLPLQQEFARKIESIEHQKETISKSIGETQRLFDYTMDKYFG